MKILFMCFLVLADVSDIFYFFLLGEGEGRVRGRREGGGCRFFIENPRGGGGSRRGRGAGRVSAANWGSWGGGGTKYFFSGPKCPPSCLLVFFPALSGPLLQNN